MERLIRKYLNKLESQGLARKEDVVFLGLDAELISNVPLDGEARGLARVFDLMNINTILFAEPAEPFKSILREVIRYDEGYKRHRTVFPLDCEMRTFFHDIPVIDELSPESVSSVLSHRKAAIVRDRGIVAYGVVTPEQAFISFSSICFSLFVKYFHDVLVSAGRGRPGHEQRDDRFRQAFRNIAASAISPRLSCSLSTGAPETEDDVIRILSEAGRAAVDCRLVDSFFGNISYIYGNKIYISQTGSSLDELERCIDAVPLDGSSSTGITASSELSAHKRIHEATGDNAILHGHPKFAVILSMHCLKEGCDRDLCHKACKERREIAGVPVVSGEVGTGPTGLLHTVPQAMKEGGSAIVYGHGVFTSGRDDFRRPFRRLVDIEDACRTEYFRLVEALSGA